MATDMPPVNFISNIDEGDEEHGFFVNKDKARVFYDKAGDAIPEGEEWDDEDEAGEEYPETFYYEISGKWVPTVNSLIDNLSQSVGTPGNEFGLFIPQEILMKTLVGLDAVYYRGNAISKTIEPDKGEYLLYALRAAYPEIEVKIRK